MVGKIGAFAVEPWLVNLPTPNVPPLPKKGVIKGLLMIGFP